MKKVQEKEKFEQYLCATIASIGALMIGTVQAWTSPVQYFLSNDNYTLYSAPFHVQSHREIDQIAALAPLGAIFGSLSGGIFADFLGRRKVLIIFTVPWIGAWILTTFALNVYFLYVARFIIGIIVGIFSTVLPMYISEIADESIKGSLGTLFQLFVTLGILLIYILGAFDSYLVLSLSLTVTSICLLVGLLYIPESPNYLVMKNRTVQAEKALRRLRGATFDVSDELNKVIDILGQKSEQKLSCSVVFIRSNSVALIISTSLMVFQQFSGINAVIFFAETIFTNAGSSSPELYTIILGATQTIATVGSSLLVERAGRKILLLFSCTVMGIGLLALGYYFWVLDHDGDTSSITWLPLTSLIGYIVAYALGMGPLPWIMTGDLFTFEMQSVGATVTATTNLVCLTLVTLYFQKLKNLISRACTFWLFAFVCGIAAIFTLLVIPETKGKTPEQVQSILAKSPANKL